jgi:5'-deoxynucleotidase YfbR-like HD superfamily hydrolase
MDAPREQVKDPRAIVRIFSKDGTAKQFLGTGFHISPRYVLTCAHVVNGSARPSLWLSGPGYRDGGGRTVGRILTSDDQQHDVVVLELSGSEQTLPLDASVLLSSQEPPPTKEGESDIIGYMDEDSDIARFSCTIVSFDSWFMKRVTSPMMAPGMSGSPVFHDGAVWGILQARNRDRNVSFVHPISAIADFLDGLPEIGGHLIGLREAAEELEVGPLVDRRWPPLFDKIRLENPTDVNSLRAFFRYVLRPSPNDSEEVDIVEFLRNLCTSDGTQLVMLRGAQGTGRSTTLLAMNAILKHLSDEVAPIEPVLIDAEKYLREPAVGDRKTRYSILDNDLKLLGDAVARNADRQYVLIFDGLSIENPQSVRLLNKTLAIFEGRLKAIVAAVSERFEASFSTALKAAGLETVARDLTLVSVSMRNKRIDSFLREYVILFHQLRGDTLPKQQISERSQLLKKALRLFKFTEVDIQLVSVILSRLDDPSYRGIRDHVGFLERYAKEKLGTPDEEATDATLDMAAHIAMRVLLSETDGTDTPGIDSEATEGMVNAWLFLTAHANHRDFLAARNIVSLLCDASKNPEAVAKIQGGALAHDFKESINHFVKNIINVDQDKLDMTFRTISDLDSQVDLTTKSFFYYVLGRFESSGAANKAKALLTGRKQAIIAELDAGPNSNSPSLKVLLRTIFISLIYLGDDNALDEYINLMLRDQEAAAINRGFHRIYYSDPESGNLTEAARYIDDGEQEWTRTFAALVSRIDRHVDADDEKKLGGNSVLFEILVFTLLSFAQSRFARGRLSSEDRNAILNVLRRCELRIRNPGLKAYFASTSIDLERAEVNRWRFILDTYQLKATLRKGWLDRNVGVDHSGRVESVADHTHLACLLAWFLLPPSLPNEPGFDKSRVINMLLLHDIAEAFTQDHVLPRLSPKERKIYDAQELAAMQYIRMKDTYPGVYSAAEAFDLWREFEDCTPARIDNVNARIAKDIDKLENLVQLFLYGKRMDPALYASFEKALESSIQTDVVGGLVKSFTGWTAQHPEGEGDALDKFVPRFH